MYFLDQFQSYVNELKKEIPNLILCGDYNICHQSIDIHNPVRLKNTSGFCQRSVSGYQISCPQDLLTHFGHFNKDSHHYTWWSYRIKEDKEFRMEN